MSGPYTFQCGKCRRITSFMGPEPFVCKCGEVFVLDQTPRSSLWPEPKEIKRRRGIVPLYVSEEMSEEDSDEEFCSGTYISPSFGRLCHIQGKDGDIIHTILVGDYLLLAPKKLLSGIDLGLIRGVDLDTELMPGMPIEIRASQAVLLFLVVEDWI